MLDIAEAALSLDVAEPEVFALADGTSEVVDTTALPVSTAVSALAVCVAITVPAAIATVVKAMQHHFLPFLNIL